MGAPLRTLPIFHWKKSPETERVTASKCWAFASFQTFKSKLLKAIAHNEFTELCFSCDQLNETTEYDQLGTDVMIKKIF
jgi:aminopeptidase C